MYLKALKIQGFKSFPDKTILPFDEEITAVVGPNGSGKSNISDAIRWVVGEQSTRMLRGGKMEDVIFGGTEKRDQTGYAEVSLVMDNSQGIFPLEESEVCVTRKYFRSGVSEYSINGHASRLRDVHELFMGTGLGKEGYALIGQGRIDEILSIKSSQRREVFEEAAGIAKFRHKKEESQRRLSAAEDTMLRVQDKISELELQVKPLEAQSETAKKFLILRDELRIIEVSLWMQQLVTLRESQEKIRSDYDATVGEKNRVEEQLKELYEKIQRFGEEMAIKSQEEDQLRRAFSQGETQVMEQEAQVLLRKNDISNNEKNAKRLEESLEQKKQREDSLRSQLAEQEEKAREIAQRRLQLQDESKQQQENTASLAVELQHHNQRLQVVQKQGEQFAIEAVEAKSLLSILTSSTQELLDQEAEMQGEKAAIQQRLDEEEAEVQKQKEALLHSQQERDRAKNTVEGYQLRVEGREQKLKSWKEQEEQLVRSLHASETKAKLLKERENLFEDFPLTVKKVMGEAKRGGLQNIHGPVANLISVSPDFSLAIETALGAAMQNIVVGDSRDAKAVIEYLKRLNKNDRATLLPLATMQEGVLPQKDALMKEPGFVGIGDQLVAFAPTYRKVISNLLGRTVIMEDFDCATATAEKFRYKVRIVTLDGQVRNTGGSVTGGAAKRSSGILTQKVELEQLEIQIKQEKEQLQAVFDGKDALVAELSGDLYQLDLARSDLRQWEDQVLALLGTVESRKRSVEVLQAQVTQTQVKMSKLQERGSTMEHSIQEAQSQIAQKEAQETQGKEEYEALFAQCQSLQSRWQVANDQSTLLQTQLQGLGTEEMAILQGKATVENLLTDVSQELQSNTHLIQNFGQENQQYTQDIQNMEELIQENRNQCVLLEGKIKQCHQERLSLEQARNQTDQESRGINQHLLTLERAVTQLEETKSRGEREESQILYRLQDTYELTHQAALAVQVPLESISQAEQKAKELKRDIGKLGHVNVNAIEEFERVNERYTYFVEERDDVLKAKKELEEIIEDIVKQMEEIFAREFRRINEAFGKIFVQLFGGGRGEVVLEDENDVLGSGIEIHAQPPGKALKIISLLSGGEKAFVAIALYFAILEIRPTPFVVMDEIEAALDDSNIERFVQYLRNICDRTQFIIITHRRGTMEAADVLYGITMQEKGVSRMLRLSLNEVEKTLNMEI